MSSLTVGQRLVALVSLFSLMLVAIGVMGLRNGAATLAGLQSVYQDRTVALADLTQVDQRLRRNGAELALAQLHNPANPLHRLHDHPMDVHVNAMAESLEVIDKHWKAYAATKMTGEEKQLAEQFEKELESYKQTVLPAGLNMLRKGDFSEGTVSTVTRNANQVGGALRDLSLKLTNLQIHEAKQEYESNMGRYENTRNLSIAIIVIGLVLCITFSVWLIRSITHPLAEIRGIVSRVQTAKDFTLKVPVSGKDEVAQTAHAFNELLNTLRQALASLVGSANKVGEAVAGMSTSAKQSAAVAADTSESASSMAAAVEQMTVSINHVGEGTKEAIKLAEIAGDHSVEGGAVIERAVNEITQIADAVREVSRTITELGQRSEKISGVVQVIKDVADQTNLLALNAAIEAARAGEAGRGFAVVADEVRKLAERTAGATGEISTMISEIQGSAHSAISAMSGAIAKVDTGVELAGDAGRSIEQIRRSTSDVVQVVSSMSDSIVEQGSASHAIASQVERVAQAAEENSATAQNSASAAHDVDTLARQMREVAGQFRI